ncbi:thiolase family protein [Lentilactobacillus kribbianus]|uniref:thiolase family protein n=1 Tax=Lentilactobacillus kribbianus TaxID=2729622 RepID=UPI0015572F34|nr:thiolase family protein [Lentilactobacillus kribbianus]
MEEVVIISAARTPIGKLNGQLASFSAVDLGTIAANHVIKQVPTIKKDIDQVIFGNAIQAGNGQNVARQIEIGAGIDTESTAYTVNQVCGSGLKAVQQAVNELKLAQANVILVGGTESMSNVPFFDRSQRRGHKYGSIMMEDGIQSDGLMDVYSNQLMGITGENVAKKFNVTRQQQDQFALNSQQKALKATQSGAFNDEIIPINLPDGNVMTQDEAIRANTNLEKLAKLKPVFTADGSVTAGNAPGLNDGATALILTTASYAQAHNLKPLAKITGYAERGIDPSIMGYAPYYAVNKLLHQINTTIDAIDLFEINEAFASQSIAVSRDLQIPANKLNINGGAIALGHPLADSGARILTTLMYSLIHTQQNKGIATLCMGGGIGAAMAIEII